MSHVRGCFCGDPDHTTGEARPDRARRPEDIGFRVLEILADYGYHFQRAVTIPSAVKSALDCERARERGSIKRVRDRLDTATAIIRLLVEDIDWWKVDPYGREGPNQLEGYRIAKELLSPNQEADANDTPRGEPDV